MPTPTKAEKAKSIVHAHVVTNVTGLVSLLAQYNDEEALLLMGGEEDYPAYEVWEVSDWLAGQLKRREHRVTRLGTKYYWARGATGQSIYMDNVIANIAREELAWTVGKD
jgi:hypothetical protein